MPIYFSTDKFNFLSYSQINTPHKVRPCFSKLEMVPPGGDMMTSLFGEGHIQYFVAGHIQYV